LTGQEEGSDRQGLNEKNKAKNLNQTLACNAISYAKKPQVDCTQCNLYQHEARCNKHAIIKRSLHNIRDTAVEKERSKE